MGRRKNKARKDGRYCVTKVIDGKQKAFYGKSTAEAQRKLDIFLEDRAANLLDRKFPATPFEVVANEWLALKENKLEYRPYQDTKSRVNQAISYFIKYDIGDITKKHVTNYMTLYKGMSKATLDKHASVMKGVFEYAEGLYIDRVPFHKVDRPNSSRSKPKRFYNKKDTQLISHYAISHDYGLLAYIILNTGLRIQEAVALSITDFIIDSINGNHLVSVNKAVKIYNGKQIVSVTKSTKSQRSVPINKSFLDNILSRGFEGYLFDNGFGEPRSLYNVRNRDHKIFMNDVANILMNDCDFPRLSPHELRHTYGTLLYNKTRDPFRVMDIMGHEDVATTKQYVHSEVAATEGEDVRNLF